MRVHEAGNDRRAPQIDDLGAPIAPGLDVRALAHGGDAPAGDGEGGGPRTTGIVRQDPAIVEDEVGGYFINPFSWYAPSAPGCRETPTRSGCRAAVGSNSASPARPRAHRWDEAADPLLDVMA